MSAWMKKEPIALLQCRSSTAQFFVVCTKWISQISWSISPDFKLLLVPVKNMHHFHSHCLISIWTLLVAITFCIQTLLFERETHVIAPQTGKFILDYFCANQNRQIWPFSVQRSRSEKKNANIENKLSRLVYSRFGKPFDWDLSLCNEAKCIFRLTIQVAFDKHEGAASFFPRRRCCCCCCRCHFICTLKRNRGCDVLQILAFTPFPFELNSYVSNSLEHALLHTAFCPPTHKHKHKSQLHTLHSRSRWRTRVLPHSVKEWDAMCVQGRRRGQQMQ